MAEMLYECDNTGEAELLVEQYLPAVRQRGFVDQLASGYLVRARLAAMRGDVASALSGLREAQPVAIECGLVRLRAFVVAAQGIGTASGPDRVCPLGSFSVVAVPCKTKTAKKVIQNDR